MHAVKLPLGGSEDLKIATVDLLLRSVAGSLVGDWLGFAVSLQFGAELYYTALKACCFAQHWCSAACS